MNQEDEEKQAKCKTMQVAKAENDVRRSQAIPILNQSRGMETQLTRNSG